MNGIEKNIIHCENDCNRISSKLHNLIYNYVRSNENKTKLEAKSWVKAKPISIALVNTETDLIIFTTIVILTPKDETRI